MMKVTQHVPYNQRDLSFYKQLKIYSSVIVVRWFRREMFFFQFSLNLPAPPPPPPNALFPFFIIHFLVLSSMLSKYLCLESSPGVCTIHQLKVFKVLIFLLNLSFSISLSRPTCTLFSQLTTTLGRVLIVLCSKL